MGVYKPEGSHHWGNPHPVTGIFDSWTHPAGRSAIRPGRATFFFGRVLRPGGFLFEVMRPTFREDPWCWNIYLH